MKSYKELLNNAANQSCVFKELTQEESSALKCCLLDIYRKVDAVCRQNKLTVMLGGGSCLGAIRHKGYIPWDDDLDLLMSREDYNQFIRLCEKGELGDEYLFTYPNSLKDSPSMFMKIYMKGTLLKGIGEEDSSYPQACFIDIFPIENMPNSVLIRKIKGFVANSLRLIANMVLESGKLTSTAKLFYSSNQSLNRYMKVRRMLGRCFSIIHHKKWVLWYDNFVKSSHKNDLWGIPTGRRLYDGETFPRSVFFPPSKGIFEGIEVNLPADTNQYLTNLYHNYMELPPKEKRERHFYIDFRVPVKYYKK